MKKLISSLMLAGLSFPIFAGTFITEFGTNYKGDSYNLTRLGYAFEWGKYKALDWTSIGYLDTGISYWKSTHDNMYTINTIPVIRLQGNKQLAPYAEIGVGLQYNSQTHLGPVNNGSNFVFADHVGFGILYGENHKYDLGIKLEHFSNAGIKKPNSGYDFITLKLGVKF